jgi:protein TonB
VYPVDLQQQGVTGTVTIRAIVGKDGTVLSPQVLNTDVHPALAQAALDAVRNWIYEPSRLNGNPIETLTKTTINFDLGQ